MTTRDQEEQDIRIDHMTLSIEKMRADIADQVAQRRIEDKERDIAQRWETRKFVAQAFIAFAAVLAAGVAIGRFAFFHQ
jgi:hypothetical protein